MRTIRRPTIPLDTMSVERITDDGDGPHDSDPASIRESSIYRGDNPLVPMACGECGVLNEHCTDYCNECGAVTSIAVAYEHQQAHALHEQVNTTLVNVLLQQGLLDDTVQAAHDAHLGDALRRIANRDFAKPRAQDRIN